MNKFSQFLFVILILLVKTSFANYAVGDFEWLKIQNIESIRKFDLYLFDKLEKKFKPDETCSSQAYKYREQVYNYYQILNQNRKDLESKTVAQKIAQHTTEKLENEIDQNHSCAKYSFATYVITSIIGLKKIQYDQATQITPGFELKSTFGDTLSSLMETISMARIALELFTFDKITMLSPKARKLLSKDNRYQLWTNKKNDQYVLSGAYDCKSQQIYLDTSLYPLDMAATIVHEMEHFFTDQKDNYPEELTRIKNLQSEKLDTREEVFWDELSATLYGSYFQRKMLSNSYLDQKNNWHVIPLERPLSDLGYVAENGPIEQYMKIENYQVERFYFFKYMIHNLMKIPDLLTVFSLKKELKKSFYRAKEIVWSNYFNNSGQNIQYRDDRKILDAEKFGLDRITQKIWVLSSIEYQNEGKPIQFLQLGHSDTSEYLRIKDVKISNQCRSFQKAIKNGELNGYAGIIGVMPGNEGVGTDLNGVKTGNEGVGTELSGAKLELNSTMRPCLRNSL